MLLYADKYNKYIRPHDVKIKNLLCVTTKQFDLQNHSSICNLKTAGFWFSEHFL